MLLGVACGGSNSSVSVCDVHSGSCRLGDMVIDITPKPVRAMAELEFTVSGIDDGSDAYLNLEMPAMYMGENRIPLNVKAGKWGGTGMIPKCHSDSTLWRMQVVIDKTPAGEIHFNVRD